MAGHLPSVVSDSIGGVRRRQIKDSALQLRSWVAGFVNCDELPMLASFVALGVAEARGPVALL
jgi:hypothetical protein